jgi:hypothetical protein
MEIHPIKTNAKKRLMTRRRKYRLTFTDKRCSSSVGTATGYGLDARGVGVRVPLLSSIFTFPYSPDQPWSPPNLLSNGYLGLTTHLQLVPRSINVYLYLHSPHTCSWGGAQLVKHRDNFTLSYPICGYSPPTSAEVKKTGLYTSTPPIRVHGVVIS